MKQRNPMQPVINTDSGVIRFKKNKIVDELLDFASARGFDLNFIVGKLCKGDFSQDDYEQFNQLIGYNKDELIFNPHVDVETLVDVIKRDRLDTRAKPATALN